MISLTLATALGDRVIGAAFTSGVVGVVVDICISLKSQHFKIITNQIWTPSEKAPFTNRSSLLDEIRGSKVAPRQGAEKPVPTSENGAIISLGPSRIRGPTCRRLREPASNQNRGGLCLRWSVFMFSGA